MNDTDLGVLIKETMDEIKLQPRIVPEIISELDMDAMAWVDSQDLCYLKEYVKDMSVKDVMAKGEPECMLAFPTHKTHPMAGSMVPSPKVKSYRAPARIFYHSLCCNESSPTDFEASCQCGWKMYYGDDSVLPEIVQDTFSRVTKFKLMVTLSCALHTLGHFFGINRYQR